MLDFVDKTFHQMPFTIRPSVIVPQDFGSLMGWDDGLDTVRKQIVDKILGSIATISNQALKIEPVQQSLGLGTVVALTGSQTQAQRIAQAIHRDWILQLKPPRLRPKACSPLFLCTCCTGVRPYNRAVNHPILHIGITGEMSQHPFPNACLTPAHEPFVHAVPIPILDWKQAPLGSAPAHPFHCFNKAAASLFIFSNIRIRVFSQKVPYLYPLIVR